MTSRAAKTTLLAVTVLALSLNVEGGYGKPPMAPSGQEHDYTVEVDRLQMVHEPRGFYDPRTRFYTQLYNDTTTVIGADMYVVKDFPEDTMILFVVKNQNRIHNTWREVARKIFTFCEFLQLAPNYFENIYENGNMTSDCPHKAGYYRFYDVLLSKEEYPKHLDEKQWTLDITIYEKGNNEDFLNIIINAWTRPIDE